MRRDERGVAMSVEAAVILPVLVLFVGLLIALARIAVADQHVTAAAAAGARAASMERTVGAADRASSGAVAAVLAQHNVACRETAVRTDAAEVARKLGQPATVRVAVDCVVELADVSLPLIPGSITVSGLRSAPVDPLRGR